MAPDGPTQTDQRRRTVLLVQPRAASEWVYPVALATLSAVLRRHGHRVLGVDLQRATTGELLGVVERERPDWLGLPVMAHTAPDAASVLLRVRQRVPVRSWVQGVHPTVEPQRCLQRTGADWAVVGDPERTVPSLLVGDASPGPGLARLVRGQLQGGSPATRVPLASLPMPDRSLFPVRPYGYAMRALRLPYAALHASRGCPLACAHCSVPARRPAGLDARTPEQVVAEISALARDHGARSILIEDDAFLADPAWGMELGRQLELASLPVVLELVNGVRPAQADPSLLRQLAAGGLRRVVYGFEHVGPDTLGGVGCTPALARQAVAAARRCGLRVGGYFVVGLPGLSQPAVLAGLRRAIGLGLDDANFLPWYRDPGSAWAHEPPPALSRARAARLARGAQAAFFVHPRAALRLGGDLVAHPRIFGALADKAGEALWEAGPVPVRDSP